MKATSLSFGITMTERGVDFRIDSLVDRDPVKMAEEVRTLMSAAEHAGAARAHLETAKARELSPVDGVAPSKPAAIAPPATSSADAKREARNARRRKARKAAGTKSSHSPRAAKRKPSTRRK